MSERIHQKIRPLLSGACVVIAVEKSSLLGQTKAGVRPFGTQFDCCQENGNLPLVILFLLT
ncbi:MAG: hypothetical protein M0T83_01705 [Nitrospiraceae bacterium]|nr:hypothetical protein [Nitrospiraceae bacterium]